eukprot:2470273-Amphidinium_carterae.1
MVLVAKAYNFAGNLGYGYRQFHRNVTSANMQVNLKKTVAICNGASQATFYESLEGWQATAMVPPRITTRDLGVDTHAMGGLALSCAAQKSHYFTAIHEKGSFGGATGTLQSPHGQIALLRGSLWG